MPSGVDLKKNTSPDNAEDATFLRLQIINGLLALVTSTGAISRLLSDVKTASTTDATPTNLFTFTTPDNDKTYVIEGTVQMYNATSGNANVYKFVGQWRKTSGGTVSQKHFTLVVEDEELAGATIQGSISGDDIRIQVVGVAATNLSWNGQFTVLHQ